MHISHKRDSVPGTQDWSTWAASNARKSGSHSEDEISRKCAGASIIPRLTELLRKIPVQPVDRGSAIAHISVQGTEVVLGTTTAAEFPKSERTPPVSGSVGAL